MALRKNGRAGAYALLIAFAVLFFCTKSSPGYPINDWADANIYLSIGKGMTQGSVMYRDLYDHKGPLLYALHWVCALISYTDFTGVFVMEVLLAAAFLLCVRRVLEIYGVRRAAWALLPVIALVIYASLSFAEGDSAEEMCLPLAAGTLAGVLGYLKSGERRMAASRLVLHGALTGCVFWIKFTMIGLHAGLLGWMLVRHALKREWKTLFQSIGWLAAGFGLATLPWVVYFGVNGALLDWLKVYLYDNLFLYSTNEGLSLAGRLKAIAVCGADWLISNPAYTVLIVLGLIWFAAVRRREGAALWCMAALGALGTFIGGKSYPYYGLALAACAPAGLIPLGIWLEKRMAKPRAAAAAGAAAAAVCIALAPVLSPNMHADYGAPFGTPREETMQYRVAALIREAPDASLLNYGFMDAGFFTAAGLSPQVKYFHQTNVPLEEMLVEQRRYISEGLCDYVVTRGKQPSSISQHYELAGEFDTPGLWYEKVYLYRKKP